MGMGRSWDDWAGALPQCKRKGRELVGPCPLCGGVDRFHVTRQRDGGALVGCRGCIDGQSPSVRREQFKRLVRTVFGDMREQPNPFLPPPQPQPATKTAADPQRNPLAKRLWAAGLPPNSGPVRAYLARRRLWPDSDQAVVLPEESLRWLPAATLHRLLPRKRLQDGSRPCPLPKSAAGCLTFAYRTEKSRLTAVSLDALTADARFPEEGRFRRTYGVREGAFFTPRRRKGNGAVVVCEGELDALAALALGHGQRAEFVDAEMRAYGGTANLANATLPALRPAIVIADGDDDGWRSALHLCMRHPHARLDWTSNGEDLAQILADSIEERISIHEQEGGVETERAEALAWEWAGMLKAEPSGAKLTAGGASV